MTDLVDRTADLQLVFISPAKQSDWDLPGHVILPGIDLEDYAGYDGDETRVLSVGNFMPQRDLMLGYSTQRQLPAGPAVDSAGSQSTPRPARASHGAGRI